MLKSHGKINGLKKGNNAGNHALLLPKLFRSSVVEARTEGGSSNSSGRAMFMQGGYFKSICSSGFDRNDLIVVCRMLGFENVACVLTCRVTVTLTFLSSLTNKENM